MYKLWLSCPKFTVFVEVGERGIITDCAPVVRRFKGQHLNDLRRWLRRFGELDMHRLDQPPKYCGICGKPMADAGGCEACQAELRRRFAWLIQREYQASQRYRTGIERESYGEST